MQHQHAGSGSSEVAQVLLSGTQQRLLSLMLNNPHQSFFTTQIIDLVQAGRGGVQRELKRLVVCGILQCFSRAHQKHYRLNTHCPVIPALRQILDVPSASDVNLEGALTRLRGEMRLAAMCRPRSAADSPVLGIVSDQLQRLDIEAIPGVPNGANLVLLDSAEFVRGLRMADPLMVRIATGPHDWVVPGVRRGGIPR